MCLEAIMRELSIREMRAELGRLDRLIDREGELIVTRRGQAIARIVAFEPRRKMPSHADFRSRLPRLSPSVEHVRADRGGR